jgi:plasmid stabilization system protein ParE
MKADEGFVLTLLAVRDLNEIWNYLSEESLEVADRVLLTVEKTLHRLAAHPGIGHLREDLADRRHRFFLVHSYLVVYRAETSPLQVIRILHASRDVQTILNLPTENRQI